MERPARGRLCQRHQPRAAHRWLGTRPGRPFGSGFYEVRQRATHLAHWARAACVSRASARRSGRPCGARAGGGGARVRLTVPMRRAVERMRGYHPPLEGRAGKLRLDFNENTMGCSPAVRAALGKMAREQVAMYPEYESVRRRLARYFGVAPGELVLTNGTDDALRLV